MRGQDNGPELEKVLLEKICCDRSQDTRAIFAAGGTTLTQVSIQMADSLITPEHIFWIPTLEVTYITLIN